MKKIYFLAAALFFGVGLNAQLTDDFESYPLGPYYGGHWTNWTHTDGAENIVITEDYAAGGTQSGYIGPNGVQDAILDVGMKTSGLWTMSMDIYIDFSSAGYFNAQHDLTQLGTEGNWGYETYIGIDPTIEGMPPSPGTIYLASDGTAYSIPYFEEEWFNMAITHDLASNTIKVYMDNTYLDFGQDIPFGSDPAFQGKLNGFDFFSASDFVNMYIDNVKFYEGELGVNELNVASVQVYPTVITDNVNIASKTPVSNVVVYNTLGQQVLKANPNAANAQLNMSSLPSGVYILKIQTGKDTLTKKVVVK